MNRILIIVSIVSALALAPAFANADEMDVGYRGWGPRVGLSMDPDQIHFGLHMDFGNFARHVRFQPNFELGVGDDVTVGTLNFEAAYRFRENWDSWSPYAGGGLGLNFYGSDNDGLGDDTNSEVGLNLLGGIERGLSDGDRFFTEVKFGVTEPPDFKLTLGWTFYH